MADRAQAHKFKHGAVGFKGTGSPTGLGLWDRGRTQARIGALNDQTPELDRPTFMRRMESTRRGPESAKLLVDEDWDVPTFLRRRGN